MTHRATKARRAAEMQADPELKAKLRLMIDHENVKLVAERLAISEGSLARYLADLPMIAVTFHGVEACIARAELRIREEPGGLL